MKLAETYSVGIGSARRFGPNNLRAFIRVLLAHGEQACPGIGKCHTRKPPLGDGEACSPKCYGTAGVAGTSPPPTRFRPCPHCDAPPGTEHAQSCPTRGVRVAGETQGENHDR